jgi:predicted anti-sigma-YlaC factor YlaD
VQLPETNCARARESVSAQLDDELTELELDRLEAHLLVCPDCSAWAEQARNLTASLRAISLEEPAERFVLARPPRRRATGPVALVATAAASLVAVLGLSQSFTVGSNQPARSGRLSPRTSAPAVMSLENARLGLDSLQPRSPTSSHGRFRARAL